MSMRGQRRIDATRTMLDELMGVDRNVPLTPTRKTRDIKRPKWTDPEMCKHFLCGWCPRRAFLGSKVDMGQCTNVHNEVARIEFQKASFRKQKPFWESYFETIQILSQELQFRIRRSTERLHVQIDTALARASTRRISVKDTIAIEEQLKKTQLKISQLEIDIEVKNTTDKAMEVSTLTAKLEILKRAEKDFQACLQKQNEPALKFEVCQICGGLQDQTKEKLLTHERGKIHQGYLRLADEKGNVKPCYKVIVEVEVIPQAVVVFKS
eukprot:UN30647